MGRTSLITAAMLVILAAQANAETLSNPEALFSDDPAELVTLDRADDGVAQLAFLEGPASTTGADHGIVEQCGYRQAGPGLRRFGKNRQRPTFTADPSRFYVSATVGSQWLDGEISGLNTLGIFRNSGSGHDDDEFMIGGAVGMHLPTEVLNGRLALRAEVEGMERQSVNFITPSFPGPPGPFAFWYRTAVTDIWSLHGNLLMDLALTQRVGFYTGFGLGVAGRDVATNDFVVGGVRGSTDFSYNIAAGFNVRLSDDLTLDLGYRYVDLGDVNVQLRSNVGAVPAGNYRVGLDSSEIRITLRLDLF